MKKLLSGIAIFSVFALASAQTISFDKTTLDYGTVKTGSDGQRIFKVKNTGDKPLILSNVSASCGCTTPVWSQDPIMPGQSADIQVGYNTAINGYFLKQITVFSNDPKEERTVLNITGTVDPNAEEKIEIVKELTPAEKKIAEKAAKNEAKMLKKGAKKKHTIANKVAK